MNLVYGQIVDVFSENGLAAAKIRVGSTLRKVSTALVADIGPGDVVLVCDDMAIGKVDLARKESDVFGYSW